MVLDHTYGAWEGYLWKSRNFVTSTDVGLASIVTSTATSEGNSLRASLKTA